MEKTSWWWQDTKESVKTAVEKTQNFVEKIGNSIKEGLNECATKAKEGLNCLVEGAKGVWNAVTNFVEEHPFIATGILIVGLAALTFFTGGAASAIFLAATKGAIMGAVTGFGTGVVTAGIKKLVHGDSYSFDDAVHDVGKRTFGGALFGAITGGTVEAGKQLWSKFGGKITNAVSKIANKGESGTRSIASPNSGQGFSPNGYNPQPGERTLNGYVQNNASPEVSLRTNSAGFNNNNGVVGGEFKRFGAESHGGVSPHVHQPIRNVAPNGDIYGTVGTKTANGGVTSPTGKDVKQLYEYIVNGKYH